MNKTITSNIGGIVFNIEIDAYEKLEAYLKEIKSHLSNEQGRDEIMTDIEGRIAEMFQEKVGTTKSVLILEDVERVIRIMGNPEDFTDNENILENKNESKFDNHNKQYYKGRRRVYRDGDNRIIGGVCSGIANYFDIDPLWIRITLAISFFFFGSGFLLYIILWIAIPEAKTTAEKLEMHGENINIDNIKKKINEEFERVNESARKFENEAKFTADKIKYHAKDFGNNFADFITSVVHNLIRVFGKFIAFLFIFFGIIFLTVITASLFGNFSTIIINNDSEILSYSFQDVLLLLFNNGQEIKLASIGIFLLVGVPLIMIIYKGVRMIFGIKHRNKLLSFLASVSFLVGIALSIYVFMGIASDFKTTSKHIQKVKVATPKDGIVYVRSNLNVSSIFEDEDSRNKHFNKSYKLFKISEDGITFNAPNFNVIQSKTDSFELVIIRKARGKSKKTAYERASNINYNFAIQDSVLMLNNYFELNKSEKWRNQDMQIVLCVPIGKSVFLSNSLHDVIYDIDNVTNTPDSKMLNRKWVMTTEGLTCVDCDGIDSQRKNKHITNIEELENEE